MEVIDPIVLETRNYLTIFNACNDARKYHKMVGIIGPPGYGKSTALVSHQMKYKDEVIMVRADKTMNARHFYSSIFNEKGGESYKPSTDLYTLLRRAANMFIEESKNMLLIIDEAGALTPTEYQYLHIFRDLTKGNTGIILSGVGYLKNNLKKWDEQNREGIPEFNSRINAWQTLISPNEDEIINIIRAYGIFNNAFEKSCRKIQNFRDLTNRIKNYITYLEKK